VLKFNRQTNEQTTQSFGKSKEVQRHPQANAQLHHICFCPNRTFDGADIDNKRKIEQTYEK